MRAYKLLIASCLVASAACAGAQTNPSLHLVPQLGMGWVNGVALSSDGKLAVTGSQDKTARLWDLASGLQLRSFSGHTGAVFAVAFSQDGHRVLTGSEDGTARLWDTATGKTVQVFKGNLLSVKAVAISQDGRSVLTGSGNGSTQLWDTATGQSMRKFGSGYQGILAVALSADGNFVLSGGYDHTAHLWDVKTGVLRQTFSGASGQIEAVALSPDHRFVITAGDDKFARVWSVETGKQVLQFAGHKNDVVSVAYSADGKTVATGSSDCTVKLWDTGSAQLLHTLSGRMYPILSMVFSADGKRVLAGTSDNKAWLWDVAAEQPLRTFTGHTFGVNEAAFSRDQSFILTAGDDRAGKIWELASGKVIQNLQTDGLQLQAAALSPDAKEVVTSGERTLLWDVASGRQLRDLGDRSNAVAFSPDGTLLAAAGWKGAAHLWSMNHEGPPRELVVAKTGELAAVSFSPDSHLLVTAGPDTAVTTWNVATGKRIQTLPSKAGSYGGILKFSPDGKTLAVGTGPREGYTEETTDEIWHTELVDAITGARKKLFPGQVRTVAFTPDGHGVLTGSADATAKLWDITSGKLVRSFVGHASDVTSISTSPDGRFVLTSSGDTTTRLWDAQTGAELAALSNFEGGGWAVTDPSGRFDVSDLDGAAPLAWVAEDDPMRALPLEIFMRDYYTPGLLSRIVRGQQLPIVRSIAEIKNRVQPDVSVISVKPVANMPDRVDVTVRAANHIDVNKQASGLEDLRLFRDGQLVVDGYREGPLKDGDFVFTNVKLRKGLNQATFAAYAFNAERIKSQTATLRYGPEAPAYAPSTARNAFLVQIGINHYAADACELQYAANDAGKMSAALSDRMKSQGLTVVPVVLTSLAGSDAAGAAKERIRKELAAIAAEATPDDVFFLSFSGHGYSTKDGQFYILPSDTQGSCHGVDDAMLKTAISADELAEWLRPIDAGEMTFILDACHSAESVEANDFKPGPMGSRGLGQLAYDKRMRILAASQSDETAQEYASLQQGLLSYVLTQEGLAKQKADWKPVDSRITVGEWLNYAVATVPTFAVPSSSTTASKAARDRFATDTGSHRFQVPALFDFLKTDTLVLQ